eukprot:scaffold82537_cov26-Attheya_sp.AAC.1
MSVSKVAKGQQWWIGLGTFVEGKEKYNPSSQFKNNRQPPRLDNKARTEMKKKSRRIVSILTLLKKEEAALEKKENECHAQEVRQTNSARVEREHEDAEEHNNKSKLNDLVNQLLEKEKSDVNNELEDMDGGAAKIKTNDLSLQLVKLILTSHYAQQCKRLESIIAVAPEDCAAIEQQEENKTEIPLDPFKFPLLTQLGLPLNKLFLSPLLREIVMLSNLNPNLNLLEYTAWGGRKEDSIRCLMPVSPSTTVEGFQKSLRRGNKALRQLPKILCPQNESLGAQLLLQHFGSNFQDEFVSVAESIGYPVTTKVMDPATAAAMWQESNCSKRAQRIITRYLRTFFGARLIVPEYRIDKLGQDHVPPVCSSFTMEKKEIHFWTKPLPEVVCGAIKSRLIENDESIPAMKRADIVIGGDHGQGKFRALAKVIIRGDEEKKLDSFVVKIGHIDCKKDTYDVLQRSVAGPINIGMRILQEAGCIHINYCEVTKKCFVIAASAWVSNRETLTWSLPIRILISGDLAFFAAVLGKPNMSGSWCSWCKLAPKEWKIVDHAQGEKWTLEEMHETQTQLEDEDISDTPQNRKGIVAKPLFDSVEISSYIISLLHCEIGIGNKILSSFFSWVDYRVEIITEEERLAQETYLRAKEDALEAEEEWELWKNQHGPEMATARNTRTTLNEMRIQRNENGFLIYTNDERIELQEESNVLRNQIAEMMNEKRGLEALNKSFKAIATESKKEYEKLKKSRGTSHIREKLENVLVLHGIERASYHGGDLPGTHVQLLFQKGINIFSEMENVMREELVENALLHRTCTEDEVTDICNRYVEICTLLDGLFSISRTPSGEATEEIVEEAKRYVRAVMVKWRDLLLPVTMPKIHGIEDHLIEQMVKWQGIGCFIEDFIEQAHQFGVNDESRTRGMRDRERAATSHSTWEYALNRKDVSKVKSEIRTRNTRNKRQATATESVSESNKNARLEKRIECLNEVDLTPNLINNYSIL